MRSSFTTLFTLVTTALISACASHQPQTSVLFGSTLAVNFRPMEPSVYALGPDGVLRAHISEQRGYLLTKESFDNFILTLEYWAEHEANSGIYIRCQDPSAISSRSCYEVNIADQHQTAESRTGSIVGFAPPEIVINAPAQWNTMTIKAAGDFIVVNVNGQTVSQLNNEAYKSGVIAIQYGGHSKDIRFRNLKIRPL